MFPSHFALLPTIINPVIFINTLTGLLLAILHWVHLIKEAEDAAAYQNFLITIEMFGASILLWFAFPYKTYQGLRKDTQGRGIPMQNISNHFKDTLNPHDVVNDAIHNFSRTYQHYTIQGDLSEQDKDIDQSKHSNSSGDEPSVMNDNVNPSGKLSFQNLGLRKKIKDDERMTLLVDSDEDEL